MSKRSKLLLGLVTIIPAIYIVVFLIAVFSLVSGSRSDWKERQDRELTALIAIDVEGLELMIKNGQVRQLTVTHDQIVATDNRGAEHVLTTSDDSIRNEIIREGRTTDENGIPRVREIEENTSKRAGVTGAFDGFARFILIHVLIMILGLGLMAFYIVHLVRNSRLDQTMRIVWAILICLAPLLAMPIYWFLCVWRDGQTPNEVSTTLGFDAAV